ncbi:ATP-grasp domain-containing protein [Magnetococcus sp. PR-3]|uniref:ATP-grasp domain-containing protein n=1 Tax=Magnetococcus sp. PR-3 TaxID=3120355 RepID=UPI002FCE2676
MNSTDKLTVAVTGINASDNPGPGIGIARSLKEVMPHVQVAGLAYDAMEPGIYLEELVDHAYLIPSPSASAVTLLERLSYIQQRVGLHVIIPTLDNELPFFIKYAKRLEKIGVKLFLPDAQALSVREKSALPDLMETCGLKAPAQINVSHAEDVMKGFDALGGPVMVKGTYYGAFPAYSVDDALTSFGHVSAHCGLPVIMQKMAVGQEMNVVGVGDGYGNIPGMVAAKKMATTHLGKIWTGVTIHHEALLQAARDFVASTNWRGPFELECMVEEDEVAVIEINPRFPAWVYFATGVGVNLPAMVVRLALGEDPQPQHDYAAGKLFIRHTQEQVRDLDRFQRMITLGEA